jgi:hypothetical protein
MKFLGSREVRLFLIAWLLYAVHFATNVVREHYPAFSIVDHGTFRVDEYQGFHADIFVHRDGHSVIGNQVLVSVLAAVPLFIFDPVLDAIENRTKAKMTREGVSDAAYRIDKPARQHFFQLVKSRGLDQRFGAAALVTSVFFMAPITAAFLVFFYRVLRQRGLTADRATVLTALLGFGTPLLHRTSSLSHNMFVMYAMFAAFVMLWPRSPDEEIGAGRRFLAGIFGGLTLATDYIGVIILPLLWAYFVWSRARSAPWLKAIRESLLIVAGTLPPIAFLLWSQWAMYGNPVLPGQAWMPNQNVYVAEGMRGMTWPDPELFVMNLFDPAFGMYTWGPLLLLALLPTRGRDANSLILPRFERRWLVVTWLVFVLFASTNQYSRLQVSTGFRYLVPLVPFLMLAVADHWFRLRRGVQWTIAVAAIVHSWVLTVFREPVLKSWQMFFSEGPQLPWYRVLSLTSDPGNPWLGTWWVPSLILLVTAFVAWTIWRVGARMETAHGTS